MSIDLNDYGLAIEESATLPTLNETEHRSTTKRPSPSDDRSSKHQKTGSTSLEFDQYKEQCQESFRHSHYPDSIKRKMPGAGFFFCKDPEGTTICIFCLTMCRGWDEGDVHPEYFHKAISPTCRFVRAELKGVDVPLYDRQYYRARPVHPAYLGKSKCLATFSTSANDQLFAEAGFFREGNNVTCCYCAGSLPYDRSLSNPLLEHVQRFPHCAFARNRCGKDLWEEIRRASQHQRWIDRQNQARSHLLNTTNMESVEESVLSAHDHLMFYHSAYFKDFSNAEIKNCLKRRIQLTGNTDVDWKQLQMDCWVRQKCDEAERKHRPILIPQEEVIRRWEKEQFPHFQFNHGWDSGGPAIIRDLPEIQRTFVNKVELYQSEQKKLVTDYREDPRITIAREVSTQYWTFELPSHAAVLDGGWMVARSGGWTKCPQCLIEYGQWKSSDDPRAVHQLLSPHCLFVLSTNPVRRNVVPMEAIDAFTTNADVASERRAPYNGVVKLVESPYRFIDERAKSFDRFPSGAPTNTDELVHSGFAYIPLLKAIICFSCYRSVRFDRTRNDQAIQTDMPIPAHFVGCQYNLQRNDCKLPASSSAKSTLCGWCHTGVTEYAAIPCRDLAVCRRCAEVRQTCPTCHLVIERYARVYV